MRKNHELSPRQVDMGARGQWQAGDQHLQSGWHIMGDYLEGQMRAATPPRKQMFDFLKGLQDTKRLSRCLYYLQMQKFLIRSSLHGFWYLTCAGNFKSLFGSNFQPIPRPPSLGHLLCHQFFGLVQGLWAMVGNHLSVMFHFCEVKTNRKSRDKGRNIFKLPHGHASWAL